VERGALCIGVLPTNSSLPAVRAFSEMHRCELKKHMGFHKHNWAIPLVF